MEFPVDGYFPPCVDQVLEEEIKKADGVVKGTKQLKKIKVKSVKNNVDIIVSKAVFQDTETGMGNLQKIFFL